MRRLTSTFAVSAGLLLAITAITPVLAQEDATGHPLVGAWTVADAGSPEAPPALAIYHADGTAVYAAADGVAMGSWSATGDTTADLTLLFPQSDPTMGPTGVATARASIDIAEDSESFVGTYTFEFPAEGGGTTGEIGPGEVIGTRIATEPMGEPVAPFDGASPAPGEMPAEETPGAEASPMVGEMPTPEASPAA